MTLITIPCEHCNGSGKIYEPMTRERCLMCDGHGWIQARNLTIRGNPDAKVRIYATDGVGPRTIHGAVCQDRLGRWEAVEWTKDGQWDPDAATDSFWDLVEKP